VSRWRSPRQRRDAHRRRRQQAREAEAGKTWLAELREEIAATRPATAADLLAREHGACAVPVLVRGGNGVAVIGDGWRVVGTLDAVRDELERRTRLAG
jgi:hypothetical protein